MEKYKYVAKFVGLDKISTKYDTCVLSISVGQAPHEGEKLVATLKLVNKHFNKCIISLCDTLQRHSLSIIANSDPKNMYYIAKKDGDQWIERNIPICDRCLDIPYEIKRWDEWFLTNEYLNYRDKVNKLYSTDKKFIGIVESLIHIFVERLKKNGYKLNDKIAIKHSKEYILEECAVVCTWYAKGYNFEIYPHKRIEPLQYTVSQLQKNCYKNLLKPVALKFHKESIIEDLTSQIALEKVINILPGHVYWKSKDGRYLGSNEKQAHYWGFKFSKDAINKVDKELIDPVKAEKVIENDNQTLQTKKNCTFEEEIELKNQKRWFLSQKAPVIDKKGDAIGLVGVSLDITEQKKLEKELKMQAENLTAALETQKRFLRNMSHEIKTPLHSALGIADALYEQWDTFSDEKRKECVKRIANSNDGLMSLITNLLSVAELKSGKMDFNMKFHDIKQLMISVLNEFKIVAETIKLKFSTHNTNICFDDYRIKQVLCNLIGNAIKHGGKDKPIFIKVEEVEIKENRYLKISVTDEGVGIPDDEFKLIFDPFYESTRTRSKAGGRGIGLTVCKEIIAFHKGKIWAENNKTKGSTFHFTLPYAMQETKSYVLQLSGIL